MSDRTLDAAATAGPRSGSRSLFHRPADEPRDLPGEGQLPSFAGATGWLNSDPLTPEALRGRVVAVDFWTYTCINWLRTAPYRRAWHARYRDLGLTLIGAHTPEFDFERTLDNVVERTRGFGVDYPVAIDSDYGVWNAFSNHFWPALYIADAEGRIRYHHYGEGEYAMSEMVIQELLREAGAEVEPHLVSVEPQGFEVAADWETLRTPETYLGFGRAAIWAAPDGARLDALHDYPTPEALGLNQWALVGPWTFARHASVSGGPGARLDFRFHARDVNLVMGPAERGTPIPFRVRLDDAPPGAAGGFDLDASGEGTLDAQRLYQLIRVPDGVRERTVSIEFLGAVAEAYCYTFG